MKTRKDIVYLPFAVVVALAIGLLLSFIDDHHPVLILVCAAVFLAGAVCEFVIIVSLREHKPEDTKAMVISIILICILFGGMIGQLLNL
jgi:hypothetical protein